MISFYAGNFSDIASDPVQESGERILFAEDSGDLFLERSGTRIRIQDVIRIDTESEREAILAPLDKIYFVTESRKLWSYISGNWFLLNEESSGKVWESEEFSPAKNTLFQFSHNLNLSEDQLKRAHGEVLFYWNRDTSSYGYTKGDMVYSPHIVVYLSTNSQVSDAFSPFISIEQNVVIFPMYDHIIFASKESLGRYVSLSAANTQEYLLAKIRIFY